MKKVRITNSWFDVNGFGISYEVFKGGELYDVTPETERQVALGNGELVDAPDEPAAEAQPEAAQAAEAKAEPQPEPEAKPEAAPTPAAEAPAAEAPAEAAAPAPASSKPSKAGKP